METGPAEGPLQGRCGYAMYFCDNRCSSFVPGGNGRSSLPWGKLP